MINTCICRNTNTLYIYKSDIKRNGQEIGQLNKIYKAVLLSEKISIAVAALQSRQCNSLIMINLHLGKVIHSAVPKVGKK